MMRVLTVSSDPVYAGAQIFGAARDDRFWPVSPNLPLSGFGSSAPIPAVREAAIKPPGATQSGTPPPD